VLMVDKLFIKSEIIRLQAILNKLLDDDNLDSYDEIYLVSVKIDRLTAEWILMDKSNIYKKSKASFKSDM